MCATGLQTGASALAVINGPGLRAAAKPGGRAEVNICCKFGLVTRERYNVMSPSSCGPRAGVAEKYFHTLDR